jgi:NTE family protein
MSTEIPASVLPPDTTPPDTYQPAPASRRKGLALCLSGGGFRAALFHLGALRRLEELGVFSQIDVFSSVSGGSILAGHLAATLHSRTDWETDIAAPFRELTRRDLRTGPILKSILPWNWFRAGVAVEALTANYTRYLTRLNLVDLQNHPRFLFCATDLAFGVNWTFGNDRCGDYQAGYLKTPANWSVARAVAASSCFPPVFNPMALGIRAQQMKGGNARKCTDFARLIAGLRLSDGGVYDNMGLEPVWKSAQTLLVSDGGSPFGFEPDRGLFPRLLRYLTVTNNQARAVRKRWLIASFQDGTLNGSYWGVNGHLSSYSQKGGYQAPSGYSDDFVDTVIAPLRTDLNPFSDVENAVLQNHGYLLAEAAIQRHLPTLIKTPAPLQIPYPEWMDEAKARQALG